MKRELAKQFNQEVEGYRRALLWCARTSDWEAFKAKAGRLFDYVESVERVELEKKFFSVFYLILGMLLLTVIAIFGVNFEVTPELISLKNRVMIVALAMCGFELYFYINYRKYTEVRMSIYEERREKFIRGIEKDFRGFNLNRDAEGASKNEQ